MGQTVVHGESRSVRPIFLDPANGAEARQSPRRKGDWRHSFGSLRVTDPLPEEAVSTYRWAQLCRQVLTVAVRVHIGCRLPIDVFPTRCSMTGAPDIGRRNQRPEVADRTAIDW